LGAGPAEVVPGVPDPARLPGTPGRVVLGIEVEDDLLSAQVAETHGFACVARELEVGGGLSLAYRLGHCRGLSVALSMPTRCWRSFHATSGLERTNFRKCHDAIVRQRTSVQAVTVESRSRSPISASSPK